MVGKHVTKVGYIIGSNVEYINREFYKEKLKKLVGYGETLFEIKPKAVCEKDSSSFYLVVYAIIDNKDKIDNDLQEVEVGNG